MPYSVAFIDAAVTCRSCGLNVSAILALLKTLVTPAMIFPAIRIPFRKKHDSATSATDSAPVESPPKYALEDGRCYLAHDVKGAFEAFSELVRRGHDGFLITSIFPEDVRKDYGLLTTPIRWLAESTIENVIAPGDLLEISLTVKDFLAKTPKPVVMLQGIDYLARYNGFTPVLRLIQGLSEANATKRGVLLLPVTPKSLEDKDAALLASETTPMPTPTKS